MFKGSFFPSRWLRAILTLLACEAALLVVTWLLFGQVQWLQQRFTFNDTLFLVGLLELVAAGIGMLSKPFGFIRQRGRGIVPEPPLESPADEQPLPRLGDYIAERSFAIRMAASGILTILASVVLERISH
jgi:hypothetical protein